MDYIVTTTTDRKTFPGDKYLIDLEHGVLFIKRRLPTLHVELLLAPGEWQRVEKVQDAVQV